MPQTPLIGTECIAGAFIATYEGPAGGGFTALGLVADGFRSILTKNYEPIVSDQYGRDTPLNGVFTGGGLQLEFTLQEVNRANVKNMAYPWNSTSPFFGLEHELGIPGALISANSGQLKLTPVTGTPAALETTPIRTYGICCLAPGHPIDVFLANRLKTIPIRLQCFPYASSGHNVFYTRS